jgi:hypothetical protein
MRRMHRIVLLAGLVALAPVLAGCEDFDIDKFDFLHLNDKKKLPGDRKDLFPQGVPGVTQGIPPEYLKGNQPQPDTAQTPAAGPDKAASPAASPPSAKTAAVEPAAEPKPKPKRKPKPRGQISVQPASQGQDQDNGQQQTAPWPGSTPQQPAPGQSSGTAPWPSAPAPGTFSR